MTLTDFGRHSRQVRFAGVGEEGQRKLLKSRVAIVGCGALGSVHAETLARAGVGFLRIIDRDFVELSNLQRQILFDEVDAREGIPKAVAAARRLRAIASDVEVEPAVEDLSSLNAEDLLGDVDLILDGTDNFETRYLMNDFSVSRGIPWVYGAAVGSYGLKLAIQPGRTACLACIYPEPPAGVQPTCETAGVLGPVTMTIAALQAADALKILTGHADQLSSQITTVDVWSGNIRQVDPPARDPECRACGARDFTYLDGKRRAPISLCGRNAVQIHERSRPVDLNALARQLAKVGDVRSNEFALRVCIESYDLTVFPDGRAIVKGTTDIGVARSVYARYVGN
jgi:molybdopterin-synthase adenylyltransferase